MSAEGKIAARACEIWWNGGAYADIGPRVTQKAGFTSAGPYDIDNVVIRSFAVYTNRPPAGALRGFGAPQTAWAYECHTDMIAEAIGIDKVEFRRRNLLHNGGGRRRRAPCCATPRSRRCSITRRADELERAVRPRQRQHPARPRDRDRLQGHHGADHLGRDRQPLRRRQLRALCRHGRHGPGLRHRDGADRRRGPRHRRWSHPRHSFRHRRHAVRHGDARLALDVPHGHRGAARRRGREEDRRARARARPAAGTNMPLDELFRRKYGMQAGNIIGTGAYPSGLREAGSGDRPVEQRHAVLGVGATGRRARA